MFQNSGSKITAALSDLRSVQLLPGGNIEIVEYTYVLHSQF